MGNDPSFLFLWSFGVLWENYKRQKCYPKLAHLTDEHALIQGLTKVVDSVENFCFDTESHINCFYVFECASEI